MNTSISISNTSELQRTLKEIDIAIEHYLNERQSIYNKILKESNHSEYDVSKSLKMVLGTCKCRIGWKKDDCSETDKFANAEVEADRSVSPPTIDTFLVDKPRWSQNPIIVAGGFGPGSGLNQLNHPNDIALDENGMIYIADYMNKRVIRWKIGVDDAGEIVAGGSAFGSSTLALKYPRRLCVAKDGSLVILDDDRVVKLPKNAVHFTIISKTLSVPTSLFVDDKNNIYVSERSNSRILKWTPDMPPESEGIVIAGTGKKGNAADQFSWPRGVFVDNCENLYVVDRDNSRIQYWPKDASCGNTAIAHCNSRILLGIKVDVSGNIYAADWRNSQIIKYSSEKGEEIVVSDDGSQEVLNSPTGLEFDQHGNMFVNDKYNHRVLMFPLESGTFGH